MHAATEHLHIFKSTNFKSRWYNRLYDCTVQSLYLHIISFDYINIRF